MKIINCDDETCKYNKSWHCEKEEIRLEVESKLDKSWNQCTSYQRKEEIR